MLDKGLIHVLSGTETAQDFIPLFRVMCNLKLINFIHLYFIKSDLILQMESKRFILSLVKFANHPGEEAPMLCCLCN